MSMKEHNVEVAALDLVKRVIAGSYRQAAIDLKAYDKGAALAILAIIQDEVSPLIMRIFRAELMRTIDD